MSINLATRALTTNQAVMQVIGHNIANANTDGYTRQRVELQAVPGQQLGSGYFGKGVQIEAVTRVGYDAFLTRESNTTKATAAAESVRYAYLQNVESLFPMGEGGLGEILNNALNAWVDVANSPNDSTARQVVLSQFDALAARIRDTYARTQQIGESARLQATETANEANRIAQAIANVNDAIARVQGSGASPNDLLDQRDRLVAQLNEKVQVTTLQADDGTLSIFVAGSLPLVLGSQAAKLQVTRADVDGDRQIKLQFVQGTSAYDVPTEFLGGGELKGLVDFINGDLIQTQAELGRLAYVMADQLNDQHALGYGLDGLNNRDIFSFSGVQLSSSVGSATLSVTVASATDLVATDYQVSGQSGNYFIRRSVDNFYYSGSAWVPNRTPVSSPLPLVFDGLSLGGSISDGENVWIRPTAEAAKTLKLILSSPNELAAAASNLTNLEFDSGNAQAILALRDTVMFDGSTTLSDGYVSVFSGLASRVNEAQTRSTFAQAQAEDAEQRRANQAGVNLDEEAARLLQFQQAYQASAKYLQTVQSIFDTLIATFR